jgi:hypothetical protein
MFISVFPVNNLSQPSILVAHTQVVNSKRERERGGWERQREGEMAYSYSFVTLIYSVIAKAMHTPTQYS